MAAVNAPTRRFGSTPTSAEIAAEALALARALVARVEALEKHRDGDEDGAAPRLLPPNWLPIGEAAKLLGFASESGLRKRMSTCEGARWWCRRGSRIFIDCERAPRRR
jgi:hypothetical protein